GRHNLRPPGDPRSRIRETQAASLGNSDGTPSPTVRGGDIEPYIPKSARLGCPRIQSRPSRIEPTIARCLFVSSRNSSRPILGYCEGQLLIFLSLTHRSCGRGAS